MLGTHVRSTKAERLAEQAWEQLLSAASSASETARDTARSVSKATSGLTDYGDRAGAVTDEARRRAGAALNALAGRRPSTPWALLLGATAAGLAVGWVAATAVRRAMTAREMTAEPVYGVTEVEEPIEPLR